MFVQFETLSSKISFLFVYNWKYREFNTFVMWISRSSSFVVFRYTYASQKNCTTLSQMTYWLKKVSIALSSDHLWIARGECAELQNASVEHVHILSLCAEHNMFSFIFHVAHFNHFIASLYGIDLLSPSTSSSSFVFIKRLAFSIFTYFYFHLSHD